MPARPQLYYFQGIELGWGRTGRRKKESWRGVVPRLGDPGSCPGLRIAESHVYDEMWGLVTLPTSCGKQGIVKTTTHLPGWPRPGLGQG